MSELHDIREVFLLQEELRAFRARLERAIHSPAAETFLGELVAEFEAKVQQYCEAVDRAFTSHREPTPDELALREFADRLAARQGTFLPDFDALYRRKAELDGEA